MSSRTRWIVLSAAALVVFLAAGWLIARKAMARDDSPAGLVRQLDLADTPPGTSEKVAVALGLRRARLDAEAIFRRLAAAGPQAVEPLTDLLGDGRPFTRALAARSLYRMGPTAAQAVPDLIDALADIDPQVRIWSAGALGEIGLPAAEPAVKPLIIALKSDASSGARRSAAVALGTMGPGAAEAVGPLIEALKDPDVTVHPYAAEALGKLGAADERVVPALKAATADMYARAKAVEALKKLGAEVPASATGPATRPAGVHPATR